MSRALAIVAALPLALAACSVDVEGAPCTTPGETTDCPSGQACGPNGTCSKHVGECVAAGTFCVPDVHRCSGTQHQRCVAGDDCGAWSVVVDCGATSLACSEAGGSPACVCTAPASELVVDVTATPGALAPTGAAAPIACRFSTITAALAYARDTWRPAHPGAPVTVKAVASTGAASPVTFGGETFPLRIPSGVRLTTESSPPAPEAWIVSADPQAPSNVVELESGATLEGFTLRSLSATGDGIAVACSVETASAVVAGVRVEGRDVIRYGASVTGVCGLDATDLLISDATKSGVLVNTASPDVGLSITGGSIQGSGESGAEVLGGLLTIQGRTSVTGDALFDVGLNARHGVRAAPVQPNPRAIDLRLQLVDVHDNGEVGILVRDFAADSAARITSSRIRKNTGTNAFSIYGNSRLAGGMLLWGNMPAQFEFQRNTVCANATDQIGVFSDDRWPLSAADCTASNVFVRPGTGYYVYSTTEIPDVEVPAINNRWAPNPPTNLVMKTAVAPSCGSVLAVPAFCQ